MMKQSDGDVLINAALAALQKILDKSIESSNPEIAEIASNAIDELEFIYMAALK